MKREYELLTQLAPHPNIIKAIDFHNLFGEAMLVLEFFASLTLHGLVKQEKRLPESTVIVLGDALIKAVAHLHTCRVLHRDVKPQNVLVSANCQDLRLIDFNAAADLDEGEPLTPIGTPLYKAPEVECGEPPGKHSDVWGCGLCIYFALSGCLPYEHGWAHALLSGSTALKLVSFDDEHWNDISQSCKDLLRRCLSVSKEDRPTMEELLEEPWMQSHSKGDVLKPVTQGCLCLNQPAIEAHLVIGSFVLEFMRSVADGFISMGRSIASHVTFARQNNAGGFTKARS
jgi:serine/threonine protein kinase